MEQPHTNSRVDEIIGKTKELLAQVSDRSIEKLKPFVARQPDGDELFACFELFANQNYGMNYNRFFPKRPDTLTSLEVEWGAMDEDEASFLPELEAFDEELFTAIELTEDEAAEWATKSEELLVKWFSECWIAAGGRESIVPTYFCLEKEYRCRDMFTGEIISEEEAARRAGYTPE